METQLEVKGKNDKELYELELYHEIRRCLLLGRKAMTNLDSILKSNDITLPTKVCLVKAMVFPVVMYGCESWTIKTKIEDIQKQKEAEAVSENMKTSNCIHR